MKKFTLISVLTTALAMTAASASAADKDGVYATIGGTLLSTELDLTDIDVSGQTINLGNEDADITMITGRLGYRLNDYFAVEGEAGFGLGGDDFDRTIPVQVLGTTANVDANVSLDVKNYYIAFARAIMPVSEDFEIFARAGYGKATAEADIIGSLSGFTASGSAEDDASGIAYGVGAQFNLTDNDGIRADFTRLEETNIISLAYSRRF
jgi:opacity protein-like surface antigen